MESARALIELQHIDIELLRNRKALEKIPETPKIADVRARLKELSRRSVKITGMLKDQQMAAEDDESERKLVVNRAREIEKENETADFRRVKNNNAELDRIAKRIEKLDYNANKRNAEIQKLEDLQAQAKDIQEKLVATEKELLIAFKKNAQSIRDDITRLEGEREAAIASLPQELLDAYDKSCKAHGPVGVATIEAGTCSGCGMQLQPSQLDELRQGPDISACPVCGRLMVVRTHGGE